MYRVHTCAARLENVIGHNEASLDYLMQSLKHADEYEYTTRDYIKLNSAQAQLNVANSLFYLTKFEKAYEHADKADQVAAKAID